jgi:flagellar basal body-associated protein FliL
MEDMDQNDTYQRDYYEPQPKKGMSGWLIALIAVLALIVVCCICACLALLLAGPAVGNVFSTVVETVEAMTPVP